MALMAGISEALVATAVGLLVDSVIFLWLAFGSLDYLAGQVIGNNSAQLELYGTVRQLNDALASLSYLGAADFNGIDSYLAVPDSSSLDNTAAFTLSYWFRAETLGNNTGLVAKRISLNDNNSYGFFLGLDGKLSVDVNSSNNRFTSSTTFNSTEG